ncbi:Chaperone protein like [Actinidia chinensis var. chinensis]|uniref:Chaperone protein like n=1 Tax=Actinidia chinensis var. chinensis TaxID=1590841 RepID=A0A2R6PU82_ACTCC|nr:Chaperone protein like [Actinidia chinensis var. chinensis]
MPDKAIDLVDEACANVSIQLARHPEKNDFLNRETRMLEVELRSLEKAKVKVEVASLCTGIPVSRLGQNEEERLIGLAKRLHQRIVQGEAVCAVAAAALRSRAGLGRPKQPTGSFLFLGPMGVRKTKLAKALAEQLFADEKLLIRIDMSEYMEQHSISRLVGAPPGYVGHEEGGQLTEAVRGGGLIVSYCLMKLKKPTPLFLIPCFRYWMMEGKVIIMTLPTVIGEGTMETARELMRQEVRKYFKPELLNLLDEILIFDPISYWQLRNVAKLQLQDVASRLKEEGIQLNVIEAALVILTESHKLYSAIWPQSGRNYWTQVFQIRSRGIRVQWRLRGLSWFSSMLSGHRKQQSQLCSLNESTAGFAWGVVRGIRTTTVRWVLLGVGAELVEHAGEGDGAVTVRRRTEEPVAESAGMKFCSSCITEYTSCITKCP